MDLVNARIVTDDVADLARFYAAVLDVAVVGNDYYVEVPTGAATLALCRRRFTELDGCGAPLPGTVAARIILDFEVDDVDAAFRRLDRLGVTWLMPPTTQPWRARSAMLRDPDGNFVNLFTRLAPEP
jgi:predicted enzyme related to lactoylglutathione lyase